MPSSRRRRLLGAVAVTVVAGLLVAGVVDDIAVHARLHRGQSQEATTTALLRRTAALLSSTTSSVQRADEGRVATQKSLTRATAELASAKLLLAQAQTGIASGDVALVAVHSCASGVSRSVSALQAGNQSLAVADLSSVAAVCENMLDSGSGGPVYPFDFADPDIIVAKGTYYAYGTNSTAGNIQIMDSSDLVNWKKAGDALPTLASWATPGFTWAPAVIHLKRSYLLYYTAATAGSRIQCISVATAKRPQGPFTDSTRAPLECQPDLGGSIDPTPFVGVSGKLFLVWKSIGGGGRPSTIWAQGLDPQGTLLQGPGPSVLLRPSQPWEGSVVEAPSMVLADGSYFLFYSANNWDSADYAIGVARCTGALGPCVKPLSRPLYGSQPNLEGPGGETVFTDKQGQLQMAFQAWLPGAVGYPHPRLLFIRPLVIADGVPEVRPPG
ncbi:MAG TPA: family 43 glycosylhydrolase [Acidimicrobiales bacterium]|nr:family 43 glycosylhydrolase [Acidimicrobiales bacterium]